MAPGHLFPYSVNYSLYVRRELQVPKSGIFKLLSIITLLSLSAFVVRYFIEKEKTKHLIQDSREKLEVATAASELLALWRSGDPAMLAPFCRDLFDIEVNYSDHYLRCNPDYMKCLLSQRPKIGNIQVSWFRVVAAAPGREWGLALKLEHNKHIETLVLGDSCSQINLPKRRYSFKSAQADIKWDNFDREISIDRFPVNWRSIIEWSSSQNVKLKHVDLQKIEVRFRHLPALGLDAQEMKSYCKYRGKRIASAQVFEAAAYHPRDAKQIRPKRVIRTPYPWSIYRKSDFLYKARKSRWKPNKADCRKAYVAGCEEVIAPEMFADPVPTWTGLVDTIGGVPEYLENRFNPNRNLFLSSSSLPASSTWHELGQYVAWNGKGFSQADYVIKSKEEIMYPILPGFRCMEEK
tara:strand:+ start:18534 stop:19754 length:1221 start_codon:yes stop_codon:yes gene_type:complete